MALSLRYILDNVTKRCTGAKLIILNSIIAATADGTANFINTYFTRKVEMTSGIEIFSDEGLTNSLGIKSK